jgi:hypothetical protein
MEMEAQSRIQETLMSSSGNSLKRQARACQFALVKKGRIF